MSVTPTVLIGVPTYGEVSIDWASALMNLQSPLGSFSSLMYLRVASLSGSTAGERLATARNLIAQSAIDKGAKYVFFIDDDTIVPFDGFLNLQDLIEKQDADLATGVYFTKQEPAEPMIWTEFLQGTFKDWRAGDVFPVECAGCGCLVIKTEVFKKLPRPWFSTEYVYGSREQTFSRATEDLYFFDKVNKAGLKTLCDTGVQCIHYDRASKIYYSMPTSYLLPVDRIKEARKQDAPVVAWIQAGREQEIPFPEYCSRSNAEIVRFESDPSIPSDVTCPPNRLPQTENFFDVVYAADVLPTLPPSRIISTIKEWIRVLKPDGKLLIVVPNLKKALNALVTGKDVSLDRVTRLIYGSEETPYRAGFLPETLEQLHQATFYLKEIKVSSHGENLLCSSLKAVESTTAEIGIQEAPPPEEEIKLVANLGAGITKDTIVEQYRASNPRVRIVSFDLNPATDPDVLTDVRDIDYPDDSFDAVYSSHVLEHFTRGEGKKMLLEAVRLLKAGGDLFTVVPDLEVGMRAKLGELELEGVPAEYKDWMLYGAHRSELDIHHAGYTAEELKALHEEIEELESIHVEKDANYNLICVAQKKSSSTQEKPDEAAEAEAV